MTIADSTSSKIPADRPTQLDPGERLFLWGFRTLAEHHRCDHPVVPAMRECYDKFGVESVAVLIEALVDAFFHTAHTPIAIHSARCPCVSEEEAFLLRAMASAQFGDGGATRRHFERWLPKAAAEWVLGPVSEASRLFQAAGLSFGLRDIERSEMAQIAAKSWPLGSQAIH